MKTKFCYIYGNIRILTHLDDSFVILPLSFFRGTLYLWEE